jgi:hypothetical protein
VPNADAIKQTKLQKKLETARRWSILVLHGKDAREEDACGDLNSGSARMMRIGVRSDSVQLMEFKFKFRKPGGLTLFKFQTNEDDDGENRRQPLRSLVGRVARRQRGRRPRIAGRADRFRKRKTCCSGRRRAWRSMASAAGIRATRRYVRCCTVREGIRARGRGAWRRA